MMTYYQLSSQSYQIFALCLIKIDFINNKLPRFLPGVRHNSYRDYFIPSTWVPYFRLGTEVENSDEYILDILDRKGNPSNTLVIINKIVNRFSVCVYY